MFRSSCLLLIAAALACNSGPPVEEPIVCPIGDLNAPAEIEIVHRSRDLQMVMTSSGGDVPLQYAIQGGHVFYAGVRAKNVDGCSMRLKGSIHDPCTGRVLTIEQRPVTLVEAADGWGHPKNPDVVTNYLSMSTCPRPAANRNLYSEPYLLRIQAEDGAGRGAEASLMVVPTCPAREADEEVWYACACECAHDFNLQTGCGPITEPVDPPGTCPDNSGT